MSNLKNIKHGDIANVHDDSDSDLTNDEELPAIRTLRMDAGEQSDACGRRKKRRSSRRKSRSCRSRSCKSRSSRRRRQRRSKKCDDQTAELNSDDSDDSTNENGDVLSRHHYGTGVDGGESSDACGCRRRKRRSSRRRRKSCPPKSSRMRRQRRRSRRCNDEFTSAASDHTSRVAITELATTRGSNRSASRHVSRRTRTPSSKR
ncbi:arginine/serine-rich coiled-coil protein 2-like [Daktulosphaira vitifoliae]|uniref:arginine/serine-rich coiled-coil protein 2-like n=1 Tax=Daktulosphaira vitifoliae TaxID=58002 RepID=UPI0021AA0EEE|nr:arginine/serine-rich coiled-coil protein 2-like [Daktulosphaira vitifoliae]